MIDRIEVSQSNKKEKTSVEGDCIKACHVLRNVHNRYMVLRLQVLPLCTTPLTVYLGSKTFYSRASKFAVNSLILHNHQLVSNSCHAVADFFKVRAM